MTILNVIVVFVLVGMILYLVNTFLPMEARVKQVMNIVVLIILVLWVIQGLGTFDMLNTRISR